MRLFAKCYLGSFGCYAIDICWLGEGWIRAIVCFMKQILRYLPGIGLRTLSLHFSPRLTARCLLLTASVRMGFFILALGGMFTLHGWAQGSGNLVQNGGFDTDDFHGLGRPQGIPIRCLSALLTLIQVPGACFLGRKVLWHLFRKAYRQLLDRLIFCLSGFRTKGKRLINSLWNGEEPRYSTCRILS